MRPTGRIVLLIVVCVGAAFGRLAGHELTGWDDVHTIGLNPHFNPPTFGKLGWYWTAIGERSPAGLYIPLTYTFWGALAKIAYLDSPDEFGVRLNPYVFHAANVALHVLASLVVFAILKLLVSNDWAACAGALLWGLHPVQVEPVGWASGTKDVLCGLLSFIAIWQYLTFARRPRPEWRFAVATVAYIAAMLSKPSAVVVPLIVLVLDLWGLQRKPIQALWLSAAWFVLAIPCLFWTKASQSTLGIPIVPLWARPMIATDALAFYLYKLAVPINLAVDYGFRPTVRLHSGWIWFTWIVPAAVAVVLFLSRRRAPLLFAGGVVFLAGLLPVLGLLPFQFQYFSTVADHYLYIPLLGPAIAVAWFVARFPGRIVAVACSLVLLVLGVQSYRQGAHWKDDVKIFSNAIAVNPRSFVSHNNLGSALFARGKWDDAELHFRAAIGLLPDYGTAHDNLALLLLRSRRPEDRAEAVEHIRQVLLIYDKMPPALRPDLDRTHVVFGGYLMPQKRLEEAADHFRAALQINPRNAEAQKQLEAAIAKLAEAATQPATQPARP